MAFLHPIEDAILLFFFGCGRDVNFSMQNVCKKGVAVEEGAVLGGERGY